jgi:hypothetical protein
MSGRKLFHDLPLLLVASQAILSRDASAYLDPGTGSYVFQVLIAAFIGGLFTIRIYWRKIKHFLLHFSKKQVK